MSRRRVGVAVVMVLLSVLLVNARQVWALSVTPSSPVAGQPFMVNSGAVISEIINVYASPGCSGGIIVSGMVPAGGSLSVPGQAAGQYSTNTNFEVGCLNFTVIPRTFET